MGHASVACVEGLFVVVLIARGRGSSVNGLHRVGIGGKGLSPSHRRKGIAGVGRCAVHSISQGGVVGGASIRVGTGGMDLRTKIRYWTPHPICRVVSLCWNCVFSGKRVSWSPHRRISGYKTARE